MKTQLFKRAKEETPERADFCTVWIYNALSPLMGIYEKGTWRIFYGNGLKEIDENDEVIFWAYNPQIDLKQLCELKYFDLQNIKL